MKTILIADDEKIISHTFALIFRAAGYKPIVANTEEEVLTITAKMCPDLTIMDIVFEGVSAIETAIYLRGERGCAVALMPSVSDITTLKREIGERGCEPFMIFPKPMDPAELLRAVRQIVEAPATTLHQPRRAA